LRKKELILIRYNTPLRFKNCPCCNLEENFFQFSEFGIFSSFFLKRVFLRCNSTPNQIYLCSGCKSKFFDVNLSNKQLSLLYSGYRGDKYFKQRNFFEPWYTRKINNGIGEEKNFSIRRAELIRALAIAKIKNKFKNVLDHGGDKGQMLKKENNGINTNKRFVYEISGIQPDSDVSSISYNRMIKEKWDFILSCHVIEHLPDPKSYLKDLIKLGDKGTVFFIEVPNETWKSLSFNKSSIQYSWLNWLTKKTMLLKLMHFISIIFKLKFKFIPPFLFPALNEHLNFFTVKGLNNILVNSGLVVKACYVANSGHIIALAQKV
jgi:hypothetical protein